MTGVPMTQAGFQAPLLAFVPDDDVFPFESVGHLAQKAGWWVERERHLGIEIVDSEGRRWTVTGAVRADPPKRRWWQLGQADARPPEPVVEAGEPERFAATRRRVDEQASRIFPEGDQALADIRAAAKMDELSQAALQITMRAQGLRILAGDHRVPLEAPIRVAHRAIILLAFIRIAFGASPSEAMGWVDEEFFRAVSPAEAELLATRRWSDEQRQQAGWQIEALVALLWALNLIDMPAAGEPLDFEAIADRVPPLADTGWEEFMEHAALRPAAELAVQAERYWADLGRAEEAYEGQASDDIANVFLANELRHMALTWILNPNRLAWR